MDWTREPEMVTEEALAVKRSLGKDLNTHCVHLEMCRVFLVVRGWENFPGETPQGEQLEMTHRRAWTGSALKHCQKAQRKCTFGETGHKQLLLEAFGVNETMGAMTLWREDQEEPPGPGADSEGAD